MRPTVFIVDKDRDSQLRLEHLALSRGISAECYNSAESLLETVHPDRSGCVVSDLYLAGMSGLELQSALHEREVLIPVILVSGHLDVASVAQAMRNGAVDVMEKPFEADLLIDRIREGIERNAAQRKMLKRRSQIISRWETMTPREREIGTWLVAGINSKAIAFHLGLSHNTVQVHRGRILKKMEADSIASLIRQVSEAGLVQPCEQFMHCPV